MKKLFLSLTLFLFVSSMFNQTSAGKFNIIPEPCVIVEKPGVFTLPEKVSILRPSGSENDITVRFLLDKLSRVAGSAVTVKSSGKSDIQLVLNAVTDPMIGDE